jgi:hypothetical protein
MGSVHSNSREETKVMIKELRKLEEEVAMLFAMDSRSTGKIAGQMISKPCSEKSHVSNANRRSILRIFESMNIDVLKKDGNSDGTANSTCENSPTFSEFSQLHTDAQSNDSIETLFSHKQPPQFQQSDFTLRRSPLHASSKQRVYVNRNCTNASNLFLECHTDPRDYVLSDHHNRIDNCSNTNNSTGRSKKIPVMGRQVGPVVASSTSDNRYQCDIEEAVEEDRVRHLTQIHDLRTWEMYLRITESRKKSTRPIVLSPEGEANVNNTTTAAGPVGHIVQGPFPMGHQGGHANITHAFVCHQHGSYAIDNIAFQTPDPEHEMIFGDLDE